MKLKLTKKVDLRSWPKKGIIRLDLQPLFRPDARERGNPGHIRSES